MSLSTFYGPELSNVSEIYAYFLYDVRSFIKTFSNGYETTPSPLTYLQSVLNV